MIVPLPSSTCIDITILNRTLFSFPSDCANHRRFATLALKLFYNVCWHCEKRFNTRFIGRRHCESAAVRHFVEVKEVSVHIIYLFSRSFLIDRAHQLFIPGCFIFLTRRSITSRRA